MRPFLRTLIVIYQTGWNLRRGREGLIGVRVREPTGLVESESMALRHEREQLTECGGRYTEIAGADIASALVEFAQVEGVAHLVLGISGAGSWRRLAFGGVMAKVLGRAGKVQIHLVPEPGPRQSTGRRPPFPWPYRPWGGGLDKVPDQRRDRRRVAMSPQRVLIGWVLALLAPAVVTLGLVPFRSSLGLPGALFCALLAVVLVTVIGGLLPAVLATTVAFLLSDFFFAVPLHSLRIDHLIDLIALIALIAFGGPGDRCAPGLAHPARCASGQRECRSREPGPPGR
jgi:two-component system sensor histidine kinase KdpD